ncbi:MAG: nucleotide sugar dehydrogenase [Planctomycetes bacterium]|nr:nucleotide sugar dehydrogenase [Planctomycetota bacterium]MBI3845841.1 nucleotide sugar dehydrogenase [Planctomycetota bacterium]
MNEAASQLAKKLTDRSAKVGVVGLGYVGLPLAVEFAKAGFETVGLDVDRNKVRAVNAAETYIPDIPAADLQAIVKSKKLRASDDFSMLANVDAVSICVPTPLRKTKDPDISYIVNATNEVAKHVRRGQLVVLESTTYPGTTVEVIVPRLTRSRLVVGEDVFVAFSPERVDPGNPTYKTHNTPKVVGGVTPACTEVARRLYESVIEKVIVVSSAATAEMVKLLENTFRSVNIGLVNEIAIMCDKLGLDVWEVIDAAATKPFGFMPFYPGPGLGGHCLAGGETVCVRDEGGVRIIPLAELFETTRSVVRERVRGVDVLIPNGLEAMSLDMATGRTRFAPVAGLFRRPSPTPLVRLELRDHRTISVTDGHPMLVRSGSKIEVVPARDLQPGARVIVATSWPKDETWNGRVDLIETVLRAKIERVRVVPRDGTWKSHDDVVRPLCREFGVAAKDVYRYNSLPLDVYLELERTKSAPFKRSQVLLATGKGNSWNQVPAVFDVDEDVARLFGYYLSEGCITEDNGVRIRFCFGAHEKDLIGDARAILDRLGIRSSVHKLKRWETVHIKVSSRILGTLLRDELRCGTRSEEMRIPERLMAAPARIRRAVVSGLLRGDGDVHLSKLDRTYRKRGRTYRHRFNAATVGYFSMSPILFQQVALLLQGMGLVPTFRAKKPHLRMGGVQVESLEALFSGTKRTKLETYRKERRKPMASRSAERHGPYATVSLASSTTVDSAPVYSMEVDDTHTFVTSFGIAVHNCIPIDPHYLSWKLRTLNYKARFIELASEVNGEMPHFVLGRIVDTLNRVKKSVNGSKVLLLGVAYKRNTSDVRESPALDLLNLLQLRGADVSYHDPFVPTLRLDSSTLDSKPLTSELLGNSDCVVIVTDHSGFDYRFIVEHARAIIDTRNAAKGIDAPSKIVKL